MGLQTACASTFGAFPSLHISSEENGTGEGVLPKRTPKPLSPAWTLQGKYPNVCCPCVTAVWVVGTMCYMALAKLGRNSLTSPVLQISPGKEATVTAEPICFQGSKPQ